VGVDRREQRVDLIDRVLCPRSKVMGKLDLATAFALCMKDGTAWNRHAQHLLKAQGLGTELDVVIFPLATLAEFELHRKPGTIGTLLDDIALAAQAEPFRPHGQRPQQGDTLSDLIPRQVSVLVDNVASECVLIVLKNAFDVDQGGSARAE